MSATSTARNDEDVMTSPTRTASVMAIAHTAAAARRSAAPRNSREARRTTTNSQVYDNRNQRAVGCGRYLLLAANAVHVPRGIGERNGLVHN